MKHSILASAAAFALVLTPVASMAQSTNGETAPGQSEKMKGPPNANGMQQDNSMKAGRSENSSSGSSNGAAGAPSTGADK